MKPKPSRSLSLPWTPQREKTGGNHLLRRKKRTSLTSPIYMLFTSRSRLLTLSSRVSCINSLTSPTVWLWIIHDHSRKYLYQLSFTCEQKPIGKKQHLYERKSHQTKMADFILQGVRQTRMYAFLVPRKEHRTPLDKNNT